jgi:hypothetical protein
MLIRVERVLVILHTPLASIIVYCRYKPMTAKANHTTTNIPLHKVRNYFFLILHKIFTISESLEIKVLMRCALSHA